jgi:hypothetical protein
MGKVRATSVQKKISHASVFPSTHFVLKDVDVRISIDDAIIRDNDDCDDD